MGIRFIVGAVALGLILAPSVFAQNQVFVVDGQQSGWMPPAVQSGVGPGVTEACYDSGCCGDCGAVECCCCPPCRPRNFVFGQALFLRATGNDVAHAQQQNGIGGAGTVPFGRVGEMEHDWNTGFKVGMGCCLDECSDLLISYSFFETNGDDTVVPPTVTGGGGAVGSLVHHPGAAITASVGPVDAAQSIEFQIADLLYRRHWIDTCDSQVNLLFGAQYGHLQQDFTQTGVFSGGSAGVIDTASDVTFDGGGLKVGLDAERRIHGGVALYGRLTAAALSGRFHGNYRMQNSSTAVDLALVDWSENRVISQVEYELGLSYTTCNGKWHARLGYLFSHWNNVVTMPGFIDAVQQNDYTDVSDTISFDGAVARIERRW